MADISRKIVRRVQKMAEGRGMAPVVVRAKMHRTETVVRGEESNVRLFITPSARLLALPPEKQLDWWPLEDLKPSDFSVRSDGTVIMDDRHGMYVVEYEEGPWSVVDEVTTLKSKYDGLE